MNGAGSLLMRTHLQALHILPQNDAIQRFIGDHIDLVVTVLFIVIAILIVVIVITIIIVVDSSNALRQTAARRQPPFGRDQLFATQPTLWTNRRCV
jgi:hypothetical protein